MKMYNSPPISWYEPDVEVEYCCKKCEEKDQTMDNAADFLTGIIEQLYSKTNFNSVEFEWILEQLCHYLKVKMPINELQICRKHQSKIAEISQIAAIDDWKKFNQNYLKELTQ